MLSSAEDVIIFSQMCKASLCIIIIIIIFWPTSTNPQALRLIEHTVAAMANLLIRHCVLLLLSVLLIPSPCYLYELVRVCHKISWLLWLYSGPRWGVGHLHCSSDPSWSPTVSSVDLIFWASGHSGLCCFTPNDLPHDLSDLEMT